jgi:hypothetical protein
VLRFLLLAGVLLSADSALAEPDVLSPESFAGLLDLRLAAADGEPSWLNGGFGKTDIDGGGDRLAGAARLEEADLAWKPQLAWNLSAVVEAELQPEHENGPHIGEAFLLYKPTPRSDTRYQVRVGLFYPPISLENGGPFWTTTNTITPSAINSWVGEEVKVAGAEASVRRAFGDQEVGLTGGVFGFDDNAGELIALRGWSFDNVRESVGGGFRLPPVSDFLEYVQSQHEAPLTEFDGRVGGYVRLDWRASDRLSLNAFAYDNGANPTAVYDEQWGWWTRFIDVGARFEADERTEVLGQALFGQTQMGPGDPDRWVNTDFSAAYVLVSRRLGDADALTGRFDLFETRDATDAYYGLTQEHGWALTADYMRPLSRHATLLVEALHIWSDRPAREENAGDANTQAQTVMQAALRLSF